MIYPSNRAATARTEKVSLKGQRIIDLGNQRVLEKRMLAQSNFSKRSEVGEPSKQSVRASEVKSEVKSAQLGSHRTVDISLSGYSSLLQTQTEYVAALQGSLSELKGKLKDLQKQLREKEAAKEACLSNISQENMHHHLKRLQLERYYSESRKLLLKCSMQLIDCKALLLSQQLAAPSERVESIGLLLHRNEVLLKTYGYHEDDYVAVGREQLESVKSLAELQQLRQVTALQEKTIQQLKTLKPQQDQHESERRLLRHEVNRLFQENEQLRKDLLQHYSQFFQNLRTMKTVTPQNSKYLQHYFDVFAENTLLRQESHRLTIERNYIEERLLQEKECSSKFADQLKKIRDGQATPAFREESNQQVELLEALVSELREKLLVTETLLDEANTRLKKTDSRDKGKLLTPSQTHEEPNMSFSGPQLSPIALKATLSNEKDTAYEALTDQLAHMPATLELFHKYSTDCQVIIGSLTENLQHQKQEKERTLRWCKKTYELLKHSNLPSSSIESHLRELYELDSAEKYTRVRSLLRDIEGLAESFDRYERKEVEEELSQYVSALKKRGTSIRQVENQDGSSVMINDCQSEAFTDMEGVSDSEI